MAEARKRLGIFVYYDENGIMDDYIYYLLEKIEPFTQRQVVVINGGLQPAYAERLAALPGITVLYRENTGMDISGYRFALEAEREALPEYDSVILYNQTCFGPVWDMASLFEQMDAKPAAFWGISRHPGMQGCKPDWLKDLDEIPPHLQSFFLVIHRVMYPALFQFLAQMKPIVDYYDAVSYFEVAFTAAMEQRGYASAAFIEPESCGVLAGDYLLMDNPLQALLHRHCPLVKRKAFFPGVLTSPMLARTCGRLRLLQAIAQHTDYPTGLIVQNLARTVDSGTLERCLAPYTLFCRTSAPSAAPTGQRVCFAFLLDGPRDALLLQRIAALSARADVQKLFVGTDRLTKADFIGIDPAKLQLLPGCADNLHFITRLQQQELLAGCDCLGVFDSRYPNVYDRFCPEDFLCRDLDIITDVDTCVSMLQQEGIGCICPERIDIGEFYSYGDIPDTDLEQITALLDTERVRCNRKVSPMLIFLGNGFYRTAALQGIAPFAACHFQAMCSQDAVFAYTVLTNGWLPAIALDTDRITEDYNYTKLRADSFKIFTSDVAGSYDVAYAWMQNAITHYNRNHNDMTLRQAFEAHLGWKQKLYIIYHLFFWAKQK